MGNAKRKVPIFKMSVAFDEDYSKITNMPEVKAAVIDELVVAIKEGVDKKKKSTSLFSLANTDYYIELDKQQWGVSLQNALDYYVKKENYKKCIECRDLIKQISYEPTTR
jgi:hypothetical protein